MEIIQQNSQDIINSQEPIPPLNSVPVKSFRLKKMATVVIIIAIIGLVIAVGVIFSYQKYIGKNEVIQLAVQSSIRDQTEVPGGINKCDNFDKFAKTVLTGTPDVYHKNTNSLKDIRWKRKPSEPFIGYPTIRQVEIEKNDFPRDNKDLAAAYKVLSMTIEQNLSIAQESLGLKIDSINTLPLGGQGLETPDVINTQIFGFTKGQDLYSVVISANTNGTGIGGVTTAISCAVPLALYDQFYNTFQIKSAKTIQHIYAGPDSREISDASVENKYEEDFIEVLDVSPDKKVFVIDGSDNHKIDIAAVYILNGENVEFVSDASYPPVCQKLEKLKIGLGMRCSDPDNNHIKVVY